MTYPPRKQRRQAVLFCLILISLLGFSLAPQGSTAQSRVVQDYSHPRLFFNSDTVAQLRTRATTTHRQIWEPILAYADAQLAAQPPLDTPEGTLEAEFIIYGSRLVPFAFACVITEATEYCDLARRYLLAYAGWQRWDEDGQRGMGLAFMIYGNSLAYDWMYTYLSPEERQRIAASLATWADRLQEASLNVANYDATWRNWWGKSYLQNHYWILHSALGLAGLALLGDVSTPICTLTARTNVNLRAGPSTVEEVLDVLPAGRSAEALDHITDEAGYVWYLLTGERWVRADVVSAPPECAQELFDAQAWVDYARTRLSTGSDVLESIQDGSWHESIYYQTAMLSVTIPFMANLRALQGTDIFPHTYLQHVIDWRLYNHIPDTTQYIFAHGDFEWSYNNGFRPQNVLRFLANEYDSGTAQWLADQIAAADGPTVEVYSAPWYVLEFLYYDPSVAPQVPDDSLPTSHLFPDFEGIILRTGWEPDDLIFGLKSGAFGGRYAFDTFIAGYYPWEQPCDVVGCSLNVGHDHADLNGFYLYGNGDWLAPEVAGVAKTATAYHNSLLIDGQGQYRPPDDRFGVFAQDFVDRDGYLEQFASGTDVDYIAADATRLYNPEDVTDVTRHVLFVRPGYFLVIDNLEASAPHQYTWISHFSASISVEGNWVIGHAGGEAGLGVLPVWPQPVVTTTGDDGLPYIHIEPAQASGNAVLVNLLEPLSGEQPAPDLAASVVADNGTTMLIRVAHPAGQQEDVLLHYATGDATGGAVGPYQFDGQTAVIRFDANQQPSSVFVVGGSTLIHDDFGDLRAAETITQEPVTFHLSR